jgi:SAM-dependent methyltransferase
MFDVKQILDRLFIRLHGPVYRKRISVLTGMITPYLRAQDRVLDIGCGNGVLGAALMTHALCPDDVTVHGLERTKRGGEAIPVEAYDGVTIPYEDNAFDVVIIADVLHHEPNPDRLIAEAARVAQRLLIIKDHKRDGLLAQQRIGLMDWAANTAYGVPCLFRYNTLAQWRETCQSHGLTSAGECTRINLYPPPYSWVFTSRLQYLAALETDQAGNC